MAQNYSELRKDNVRDAIYEDVANNLEVLRTSWAGNAFPENPKVGQACYRIDEDNLYFWDGTTWSQKGGGGIDMNTGDKLYDWVGTLAEYREQDIENQHPDYLCFITDDETPVVCATRSLDNLDAAGQAKFDGIIKAGMLSPFAGSTAPDGWLICDGSAISRTTYAALFAVIGTTYGEGDGSTTFNIPNFINRTFWGGSGAGAYLSESLPNITGTIGNIKSLTNAPASGAFGLVSHGGNTDGNIGSDWGPTKFSFDASRSSSTYQNGAKVRPDVVQTLICIKY